MASTIKVNNVQASDGGNIINQCGTTITLGASGDTINLASGASQTGFGRTGTVNWQTGSIKTTGFTAANGEGYFCDTSSGGFTATLPASPTAGDIVAFSDYTRTFGSNNLTLGRNSKPIGGVAQDGKLNVDGQSATFVFVDNTEGWININETQTSQTGENPYIEASVSGCCNTLVTAPDCANVKVATFVNPGTYTVTSAGLPSGANTVDYMVVAGGGGGGSRMPGNNNGGGGAGGFRESPGTASGCYTASPRGAAPAVALAVAVQGYPIQVGGGGAGGTPVTPTGAPGSQGSTSTFSTISSAGGGYGGSGATLQPGGPGGSGGAGGGGGNGTPSRSTGGNGNDPATNPVQGTDGGEGAHPSPSGDNGAGGGGGAICAGSNNPPANSNGGNGGAGATTSITGSAVQYAGGGGAGSQGTAGTAGGGGGGTGGSNPTNATNGTDGKGGGGGGGSSQPPSSGTAGNGGSGVVVIRYKFQ